VHQCFILNVLLDLEGDEEDVRCAVDVQEGETVEDEGAVGPVLRGDNHEVEMAEQGDADHG